MRFKQKKTQGKKQSIEIIKKKIKRCRLQILKRKIQIKILITIIKIIKSKKSRKKGTIFEFNEYFINNL